MSYIPPPDRLGGFPDARRVKGKTVMGEGGKVRRRWVDDGNIYEWDYQHGRVEKYNNRGIHLGEFDAETGVQTKTVDPSRSIKP